MAEEKKKYKSFHDLSPRDYMYFPKGTVEISKPGKFSRIEIQHLVISIIVLTIAFTFALSRNNLFYGLMEGFKPEAFTYHLARSFLGILTAFFIHELSHKFIAQKYGLWAEYRMFPKGLKFALMLGFLTPFVFAAPGAVMFQGDTRDYETGKIAAAGPMANIILATITLIIFLNLYATPIRAIIGFICLMNAFLATFNLIPYGPLDGIKIVRWNETIWIIMLIISSILLMQIWPKISI